VQPAGVAPFSDQPRLRGKALDGDAASVGELTHRRAIAPRQHKGVAVDEEGIAAVEKLGFRVEPK
jgi:hypothetical protein